MTLLTMSTWEEGLQNVSSPDFVFLGFWWFPWHSGGYHGIVVISGLLYRLAVTHSCEMRVWNMKQLKVTIKRLKPNHTANTVDILLLHSLKSCI